MSARVLSAELAAVRALVTDGLTEIGDAGDAGHVWIRSATARLTALDGVLTEAAGVLAAPSRVLAVTIVTFLVVAGSAALAGVLGLGAAGILALSGAALLITAAVLPWAARIVYTLVGRRRLARVHDARPSISAGGGLAGVPDLLLRARVRLVSAALRQVGAGSWTAPELRRAIRTDPVVHRLAQADQLLCQAVDCVERHLGDLRKDSL